MYLKTYEGLLFIEGEDTFIPWLKQKVRINSIRPPDRYSPYYTIMLRTPNGRGEIPLEYIRRDVIGYGEFSRSPFEGLATFLFTDG